MISGVAAGDRAAFRRLYAFMAMRVWHIVTEARLCPAVAVAVARSTFVEMWHSARAATHYDARGTAIEPQLPPPAGDPAGS